jgi:hypothetical protein
VKKAVRAAAPIKKQSGGGFGGGCEITITAPAAGSIVSVPFSAYGTASNCTASVSGRLIVGGTRYAGTTVTSGLNWQITFNQPQGVLGGAEIRVTCGDGSAEESVSLHVPGGG